MAKVTPELIRKLRELSGAGMMDCKSALEEADGDVEKAYTILREQAIPKIVDGQVEKFIQENVLLEQPYFRDPKHPVKDLIAENISKLQENITVRRFSRFNVREA